MSRRVSLSRSRRSDPAPAANPALTRLEGVARAEAPAGRTPEGPSGQPLAASARAFFEPRLGRDLAHVRIHSGPPAERAAGALGARAFTVGSDIYFGRGEYQPGSASGRRLLAHEIAHVFQDGAARALRRKEPSPGGSPGGFFANIGRGIASIFGAEPGYSPEELNAYLDGLKKRDSIEDDYDSDNKAVAVVAKKLHQNESLRTNILLVDELLTGAAMDDDEQAVLAIVRYLSREDRNALATAIGYERLYDKFDGEELDKLYVLLPALDSFHPRRSEDDYATHSRVDYIEHWEHENGVEMTPEERKVLARGCIGITAVEIGLKAVEMPDLTNCYDSFARAWAAREKMDAYLQANQPDRKTVLFSKRFYSEKPRPKDEATGKVDMQGYDYQPKPEAGMTNYDYGLFDDATGKWWHANSCDTLERPETCGRNEYGRPRKMEVYESSLKHYSRELPDFNGQIFCLTVGRKR
jgi:hypothetical protein